MEISWIGHASFRIKGKNATVITDPYDPESTGLKLPKQTADIVTISHDHGDHNNQAAIEGTSYVVKGPGEYEIKTVNIIGVASYHDSVKGEERGRNTIYNISVDDVNIVHLGDLGHELTSEQVDDLGNVDILLVPVGGVFTIDAHKAAKIASSLEAKVVIPMHYKVEGLKYELEPVDKFLKEMGNENVEPVAKYVVTKDKLPTETQVVLLSR